MRFPTIVAIIYFFVVGCGNTKTVNLPPVPTSADAVSKAIKGKKFKTAELALISSLEADKNNPYEWFDEIKDTTPFFKNYEKQKLKFELDFGNDTIAIIRDESGINTANWKIDDQPKSDETAGLFLRLSVFNDEKLIPGQIRASMITFSYKVLGINDKELFLQTPNMFKMKKVAVLMKTE